MAIDYGDNEELKEQLAKLNEGLSGDSDEDKGGLGNAMSYGGLVTTAYGHLSDIYDLMKADVTEDLPTKQYSYGQMPDSFVWQPNPYEGEVWRDSLNNSMEGFSAGMQTGNIWGALGGLAGGATSGLVGGLFREKREDEFERRQKEQWGQYNVASKDYDMFQADEERNRSRKNYMSRQQQAIPQYGTSIYSMV